ncbi:MAG: insulinase family protein [Blastocatellia bacterium]|nr:insulinase family protein [Blastocatellia bacterium]
MRYLLLIAFLLFVSQSALATESSLKLPPYKKVKLTNGMTLFLVEQNEIPLVNFSIALRAGSTGDPNGKEGLASITASMLRKGTKTRTADKISSELDFVGGSLFFGARLEYSAGAAEFLKKDLNVGLDLLSDVLINPTFPKDELDKLLKKRIDEVIQTKESPDVAIDQYYDSYLYADHPYSRPTRGSEKSLANITLDDVKKFYDDYYTPENLIVAVVGDFTTSQMEAQIREKFEKWTKKSSQSSSKLSEPTLSKGHRLLLVDKPDATQTYFNIGNTSVNRYNPDRVGIDVVNTLFGVRFTSMLNTALRINSGLSYGAVSNFNLLKAGGDFRISTYTQNATTEKAMDLALDILKQLHEKGITEEQLKSTKIYVKAQMATTLETSGQIAAQLTNLEIYGLDEKEINDYFSKVDSLTLDQTKQIIAKYFPLENLVFVLIGKKDDVGEVIKKYAPKIDTRKIEAPGFN